ncbi:hypothetical protein CSPB12327_04430 [Campylobacter sp. RM12327]|uniref:Uncharacterized protein n=1 Tax=Campylobacter sputorum subsp. sputorum TaxID=32024 RepID=A0A381DJR5_9BACT|nr:MULTISPECIES: hypothetical protein [Campylobacter]ASM35924.1 hypothetical protein CSPUT_1769 [Campylobacter sputorum aubsp. sputorum RM3237]ASM37608.1 hypothetical protein CSF_1781 [Campylobacter sputorum bv. faecalis CCUG 20703]ASM39271.1 hypothetical protein CSPARA_1746 [Campylobacter sputorum bv. paraureolyticus LMG 11764]ASM40855.1 hypothetical protein CSPB_1692 [Campylobacter sputorum]KAB0582342.1 hypothetical protein F7P64_03480 [Campylobacter sputorum subsp. sputorum]
MSLNKTKFFKFIFRTFIAVFVGYFLSYKFAIKLPEILNLSNQNKIVFANFFLMGFFTFWAMLSYILDAKYIIIFCIILLGWTIIL